MDSQVGILPYILRMNHSVMYKSSVIVDYDLTYFPW